MEWPARASCIATLVSPTWINTAFKYISCPSILLTISVLVSLFKSKNSVSLEDHSRYPPTSKYSNSLYSSPFIEYSKLVLQPSESILNLLPGLSKSWTHTYKFPEYWKSVSDACTIIEFVILNKSCCILPTIYTNFT